MYDLQGSPPSDLVPFLKGWGSLTIATIALIRPWVGALWRRLFRRGDIDMHPTTRVEVGYSTLGPTIGLTGTLRAVHRDQFVESMHLVVTKLKDGSHHQFDWFVSRAGKYSSVGKSEITAELVSGFMLATAQPHSYNVLFQDAGTQEEIRKHLEPAQSEWMRLRLASEAAQPAAFIIGSMMTVQQQQRQLDELFKQFMMLPVVTQAYSEIDRLIYWEPGTYGLELIVNTTRPDVSISDAWEFTLGADDVKSLRLNAVVILREVCDQSVTYNFAYPAYEEAKSGVA